MNTRRGFLRSLVAAVAVSPLLARFSESLAVEAPKREEQMTRIEVNPEYISAPYEQSVICHGAYFQEATDLYPPRFVIENGEWRRVEPFITSMV